MTNGRKKRRVKTTDTVFAIIEALRALDGATVSELANELDIAASTAHNHLSTLHNREYIIKDDGVYKLGLRFLDLGIYTRTQHVWLKNAQPPLEQLAEDTGEVAWLMVEEHGLVIHLCKAMGESAVQTYGQVGKRAYMHQLAAGKSILAYYSDERVEEIINKHGLPQRTDESITDKDDLFEELETIRERGYAFNDEEVVSGLRSVGTPIFSNDDVIGSICVSAPANRMIGERYRKEIPDLIMGTANEIELKLTY